MYMSLQDLREKFVKDNTFAQQFVNDAREVGITVNILDQNGTGAIDEELLYGNDNLLNTYVNVVQQIITQRPAGATRRLASYIHAPFYREEDFYIDPDTRVITVPKDFAKNGVGVVGDHLAELLFFSMPRFFDVVDLFKCKIYVYWRNTGLKDYAEPHISEPIAVYPEGDDLHFGWYLTEEATEIAGQIEFSVEFIIKDETTGEVTFRLYTQPAKITIKNSIDMDASGIIPEDRESLIYSRAIYSNVVNLLTAAPAIITENLPTGDLNLDPETGTITLHADAIIPAEEEESNKLVFGWNWNGVMVDQPEGDTINDKEHLVGITTYELASKDGQGNEIKTVEFSDPIEFTVENEGTENEEIVPALGTTYKTLKTNVPGAYQVYVGNVVDDPNSANYGGIRYVYSHTAYIAPASAIEVNNKDMPATVYMDKSPIMTAYIEGANGSVECDWYHITPSGTVKVTTVPAIAVTDANHNETGAYKSVFDPSNGNSETYAVASYRGLYYVEARNTKNNTVERAQSSKCFVEVMPVQIPDNGVTLTSLPDHFFQVEVANPQFDALTYELTASIRSYFVVNGEERTKETPVYFDNTSTYKYFNAKPVAEGGNGGVAAFQLNDLTVQKAGLRDGSRYTLFVSVVPIAQYREPGLERYATKIDATTNTEVPARTYVDDTFLY